MARKKTTKAKTTQTETKTEPKSDNIYTVVRGDTPQKIARKLSIDLDWLTSKNKLTERLEIGQELIVKD
jgi:LysM repeat protein